MPTPKPKVGAHKERPYAKYSISFNALKQRIHELEQEYQRPAHSVTLIAVSKNQSIETIRAAIQAGQRDFAENYVQEALDKIRSLSEYNVQWHFIGSLQSNKAKVIAEHFSWVQSLESLSMAERLNCLRPTGLAPLNVCIQVKLSQEISKSGVHWDQLEALAQAVSALPHIRLRGLMGMLQAGLGFDQQRALFRQLYQAQEHLKSSGLSLDTLSMGMSDDFTAAVAEGSTMLRIGTALFGPRESAPLAGVA